MSNDWRDGFLFVGNHLALDFLNTRPMMDGQLVEMLPDCGALARWLAAARLITKLQSARLKRRWSDSEFTATLDELWKLRESFRKVVFQMEAGHSLSAGFIEDLNRLLLQYPYVEQVGNGESGLERRKRFAPELPADVFVPLADAIADLLTNATRSRIRKCRNCILHFYDTSNKGTRLWCSMNLCGNRSKVAAYAERKRAAAEDE
jgi:predicted RNA-binding Zn ribbon-like protein